MHFKLSLNLYELSKCIFELKYENRQSEMILLKHHEIKFEQNIR